MKDLREEVEVGDEGCLENDGDVGGIEELDGVRLLVTLHLAAGYLNLNTEAL
jgi:hypothetical protein